MSRFPVGWTLLHHLSDREMDVLFGVASQKKVRVLGESPTLIIPIQGEISHLRKSHLMIVSILLVKIDQ
jgi:hypothetical protein